MAIVPAAPWKTVVRCARDYLKHMIDRREHFWISVRLVLSFSGWRTRGEGMVMDLSMGGCIIKSEAQIHVNDIFYLQISIEDGESSLELAAIVWAISARGIAFKSFRAAQENIRLLTFVQANSVAYRQAA